MSARLFNQDNPVDPAATLPTAKPDAFTNIHGKSFVKMNPGSELLNLDIWMQRHASLRALESPVWTAALKDASIAVIPPNTVISGGCDEAGKRFVIVLEGSIKVQSTSSEGRVLGAYRVEAGELCSLSLPLMSESLGRMVRVSTESRLVLLKIPVKHLDALRTYSHAFRDFQFASIANQFGRLINRVEETTFLDLENRILNHLRTIANAAGSVAIAISHQTLADDLGSKREAISRALKDMKHRGQVRLGRRMIELLPDPVQASPSRKHDGR